LDCGGDAPFNGITLLGFYLSVDGSESFVLKTRKRGGGIWKIISDEKTWWPSSWNELKVWTKISEAFNNKVIVQGPKWYGTTSGGIYIEMYIDNLGDITTAYIIPQYCE
jgi:Bacterial EndoU nuclease